MMYGMSAPCRAKHALPAAALRRPQYSHHGTEYESQQVGHRQRHANKTEHVRQLHAHSESNDDYACPSGAEDLVVALFADSDSGFRIRFVHEDQDLEP